MHTKRKTADSATNTANGKEKSLNSILNLDNQNVKITAETVRQFVLSLGISPNLEGFECVAQAIVLICNSSKQLVLTTELYPRVAQMVGLRSRSAERSIRYAISSFKKTHSSKDFESIFGFKLYGNLTNSKFMYLCAEKIKQGVKKRDV